MFQFLGRNSGRSDKVVIALGVSAVLLFQFLGRNSGRSDDDERAWIKGFNQRFNSSVGILVVRTPEE